MMVRKRFPPTTQDPSSAPNASLLWPTTLVVNQARRRGDSRNRANAGEGGQGHQGAGGGGTSLQDDPPVPAVLPCAERNVKLSHAVQLWRGALGMMYKRMRMGLQFGVLDAPATHVNMWAGGNGESICCQFCGSPPCGLLVSPNLGGWGST